MKLLEYYVNLINNHLENPRKKLSLNRSIFFRKKREDIIKEYDKMLLEKYCYLEKLLDEELKEDTK